MEPIPATLYKYMSFGIAQKVISGNRLRATPPNDFNDPFEMLPKSYIGMTDDIVYKMAEDKCFSHSYYQIVTKQLNLNVCYEAYRVYLAQNLKIIEDVAANIKSSLQHRNFASLVDQASSFFGVLCFSSDNDNILMWSHYAEDHKGVVIGFDSTKLSNKWFPVNYRSERVDIPFGVEANSPEYQKAVCDILSTKYTS